MRSPLLSLRRIYKRVEGEEILKGINLDVFGGDFLSVVGESGSGKSSLLYIMGLLDRPSEGSVFFEGKEVNFDDEDFLSKTRNRKLGFVFQFHYLIPELTALENVMVPMLRTGTGREEAEERARSILESVGPAFRR